MNGDEAKELDPALRPFLRRQRVASLVEPVTWWVAGAPVLIDTAEGAHAFAKEEGFDPAALYAEYLDPYVE